jgi:predicted TIM-barrel fold metal-dependent hydrolase
MTRYLDMAREGHPLWDLDIVDIHGHIGRCEFGLPDLSLEGLIGVMDRVGVRQVIVSHTRCLGAEMAAANDGVGEAILRYPERMLGYIAVFPADAAAIRREVERRARQQGFVGLKLHNVNGFAYDDDGYLPAYEIADAQRMPVLLHTWAGASEMAQIRKLAARFPAISFILAHAGAGGAVEPYLAIAREYANIYCDLTLSVSPTGLVARLVGELGAARIVWGSDVYFLSQTQQIGKALGARIGEDDLRQILGGNARRILARRRPAG